MAPGGFRLVAPRGGRTMPVMKWYEICLMRRSGEPWLVVAHLTTSSSREALNAFAKRLGYALDDADDATRAEAQAAWDGVKHAFSSQEALEL